MLLAKERLERYWDRVKHYKQNWTSEINKENSTNNYVRRQINNRMQKRQNNTGRKYGKKKIIIEVPNG